MAWPFMPGGISPSAMAGDGFAFDNEGPRHQSAAAAVPHRFTPGEYRRWRIAPSLRMPQATAGTQWWLSRRLDPGSGGRLKCAALLADRR